MSDQNEAVIHELLKVILANKPTALDHLPKLARETALISTVKSALIDKNAKFDIEGGLLRLVRTDGANVFGDDHRQWDAEKLIDYALQKNNLSATSGSNNQSVSAAVTEPARQPIKRQSTLSTLVNSSLTDLENAHKRSMM